VVTLETDDVLVPSTLVGVATVVVVVPDVVVGPALIGAAGVLNAVVVIVPAVGGVESAGSVDVQVPTVATTALPGVVTQAVNVLAPAVITGPLDELTGVEVVVVVVLLLLVVRVPDTVLSEMITPSTSWIVRVLGVLSSLVVTTVWTELVVVVLTVVEI